MGLDPDKSHLTPIRAAGGIILGTGENKGKIAVVRRRRYTGEVGLPKGKVKVGETDTQTALREVYEETGIAVRITRVAGETHYFVNSTPKVVTYFMMEDEGGHDRGPKDTDEIAAVEWLIPEDAIALLTHQEDRDLIERIFEVGMKGS
jgi:8-oxo-dGTP pyrophosphatase MutT (NUDIX family)